MVKNFPYEDIVDLPRPKSKKYPQSSMSDRAARFSPFAAITGYEEMVFMLLGFAILLLVFITNCKSLPFTQKPGFSQGISFWKAMFIPVVIAMTATQDVFHMLTSGIVAITAGAAAFGSSCLLLYLLRIAEEKKEADQS